MTSYDFVVLRIRSPHPESIRLPPLDFGGIRHLRFSSQCEDNIFLSSDPREIGKSNRAPAPLNIPRLTAGQRERIIRSTGAYLCKFHFNGIIVCVNI